MKHYPLLSYYGGYTPPFHIIKIISKGLVNINNSVEQNKTHNETIIFPIANTIEYSTNGSSALKFDGINKPFIKYNEHRGGDNIKKHKVIKETQMNGFKVISYVEDISLEERTKKDNQLAKQALKIMAESKIPIEKKY